MRFILLLSLIFFALPARAEEDGGQKALPLPRFVSLKSDEVNVRSGPGERYPILWIYRRNHMPVEITEEFEHWRKVRDAQGDEGWILKSLLDGRRYGMVKGATRTLLREPEKNSPPILRAGKGVIGKLTECNEEWCRLQIDSRKGWLPKAHIWGVYKREIFEN